MRQGNKEFIRKRARVFEKNQYGYDTQQMAAQLYSSDPSKLHSKCLDSDRGHESHSQYKLHLYGFTSCHAIVTCLISR